MQFNGVNNKECQRFLVVSGFCIYICIGFHVLFVGGILVCALCVYLKCCEEWQLFVQAVFPTHSLPLSTVYSV